MEMASFMSFLHGRWRDNGAHFYKCCKRSGPLAQDLGTPFLRSERPSANFRLNRSKNKSAASKGRRSLILAMRGVTPPRRYTPQMQRCFLRQRARGLGKSNIEISADSVFPI